MQKSFLSIERCTDKNFFKVIQSGAVAQSNVRIGFLIYEKMRKYFPIYEEAFSHI
jgi:hypothetical protein